MWCQFCSLSLLWSCIKFGGDKSILFFYSFHIYSQQIYHTARHKICQKIYTTWFSGQKFYTLIFTKLQQFWWWKHQKISENGEIYTAGKNFTLALCVVMNIPKNIHIDFTEYCFHNWRQQAWSFEIGWPLDLHTGGERWRRRARYLETGGGRHPQPHLQVFWCLPMSCTTHLKLSGLLNLEMEKMKWNCPGKNT